MENLNVGITLMVIGMSMVFVFLVIMIVAMHVTTKIIGFINKYFPEPMLEEKNTGKKKQDDESEIALAIAVSMRERAKVV
jgi:sodium pump decarboxylase gamma subunit